MEEEEEETPHSVSIAAMTTASGMMHEVGGTACSEFRAKSVPLVARTFTVGLDAATELTAAQSTAVARSDTRPWLRQHARTWRRALTWSVHCVTPPIGTCAATFAGR